MQCSGGLCRQRPWVPSSSPQHPWPARWTGLQHPALPEPEGALGWRFYQLCELDISRCILFRKSLPSCGEWRTRKLKILGENCPANVPGHGPGARARSTSEKTSHSSVPHLAHSVSPHSFLALFLFPPVQHPLLLLTW